MLYDVAIIGAGAAGLAASRRLRFTSLRTILLEARDRVGGRAHSVAYDRDLIFDLGCEWLHSADQNPLALVAKELGFTLDASPPRWGQQSGNRKFSKEDQEGFGAALQEFENRLEAAAAANQEGPAAVYLDRDSKWTALINAFSSFYNGVEFENVSVLDYAAYRDTGVNWRVLQGYGTMIAALGAGCELSLETEVMEIDHAGPRLQLRSSKGVIEAKTVIITVPPPLIASQNLRFRPALPEKVGTAAGLPLGLADKVFLEVGNTDLVPKDGHVFGKIDRTATGSYHLRPSGLPYIECFFGGANADALETQGRAALAAFAVDELCDLFGNALRPHVRPLHVTLWRNDRFAGGSYSYARPGHRTDRARLSEPVGGRLFFAGEACSEHSFSTAHGAYETGLRAAEEALAALS